MNNANGLKFSHAKCKFIYIGTPKVSAVDWSSSVEITEQGTGGLTDDSVAELSM